jgi:putative ABC transport system ATP-binding protein/lipoprotein-releasing system ATP-binding protein
MSLVISFKDVSKRYTLYRDNEVMAVRNLTLEIPKGEFGVITGRSGSGKTTLLNLAGGLTRPSSGEVLLDGVNLWQLNDNEQSLLRNRKVGFVFQFPSLVPSLNALENVMLPTIFGIKGSQNDARGRAGELLHTVGLSDKLNVLPRQLSAGQQQRIVIARSLINQIEILLADEATSDLDEQTEREIMELFREIHQKTGITVVIVTHTSQLVSYGTRWLEMAGGTICSRSAVGSQPTASGSTEDRGRRRP